MASLSSLDPDLQPFATALVEEVGAAGLVPRVTSTRRSYAQQARLYRASLSGLSPYPAAPPGNSSHELGLAFDMVVSPMDALPDVGALWESWGGEWGGRFKDPIHFQAPGASRVARSEVSLLPSQRQATFYDQLIDLGIGFLPIVGEVEMASALLQLIPALSESQLLDFLASPSKLLHAMGL